MPAVTLLTLICPKHCPLTKRLLQNTAGKNQSVGLVFKTLSFAARAPAGWSPGRPSGSNIFKWSDSPHE